MTKPREFRSQQKLLDLLRNYLEVQLGCHTAILYGSRARGDWDCTSDIDVIAFRDAGETGHLARRWQGLFLDLFIYPSKTKPEPDWLRIHGGAVLFQRGLEGNETLAARERMFSAGPETDRPKLSCTGTPLEPIPNDLPPGRSIV